MTYHIYNKHIFWNVTTTSLSKTKSVIDCEIDQNQITSIAISPSSRVEIQVLKLTYWVKKSCASYTLRSKGVLKNFHQGKLSSSSLKLENDKLAASIIFIASESALRFASKHPKRVLKATTPTAFK